MLPIPTLLIIAASAAGSLAHSHNHIARSITNGTWYHEDPNHPVHELFKRAPSGNRVGSDAWKAQFPPLDLANPTKPPDASKMPQAWLNALNGAIAAKKIPDIPIAISGGVGTQPTYPNGLNPNEPRICSGSAKCKNMELGDVWDAPEGFFATSFDDGPVPSSRKLLAFLASEKIQTTHFLIGVAMVENPAEFQLTIDSGNDLAVHTWTHPQMTTLSNIDVVAQLGYTMDIIYQSTGKVPRYWRPPTGDADNRVRAIALNVFGLRTMFWNSESDDWRLNLAPTDAGHRTGQQLTDTLKGFATGPKSPGRIVLNHETSDAIVQGFIDAFPTIKSNGWQIRPITQLASLGDAGAYRPEGPANILVSGAPTISVSLTSTPDAHSQTSTGGPSPTGTGPATTSSATTGTPGGDTSRPPNSGASTRASLSLLVLVFVISVMSL